MLIYNISSLKSIVDIRSFRNYLKAKVIDVKNKSSCEIFSWDFYIRDSFQFESFRHTEIDSRNAKIKNVWWKTDQSNPAWNIKTSLDSSSMTSKFRHCYDITIRSTIYSIEYISHIVKRFLISSSLSYFEHNCQIIISELIIIRNYKGVVETRILGASLIMNIFILTLYRRGILTFVYGSHTTVSKEETFLLNFPVILKHSLQNYSKNWHFSMQW